ncbi:hypothetical protein K7711_07440 [Nocardia sp. CA2R105]|nr:hypothetical protein [Nocardia coffeae]MBY8856303.1 hypothetical protein [Nocardia coffeae]
MSILHRPIGTFADGGDPVLLSTTASGRTCSWPGLPGGRSRIVSGRAAR